MPELVKGNIVWAKVEGYDWWPAKVIKIAQHTKNPVVVVSFFGENKHADLPKSKVMLFDSNFEVHSKARRKQLMRAIELAKAAKAKKVVFLLLLYRNI